LRTIKRMLNLPTDIVYMITRQQYEMEKASVQTELIQRANTKKNHELLLRQLRLHNIHRELLFKINLR
jgi:hypothetical protein